LGCTCVSVIAFGVGGRKDATKLCVAGVYRAGVFVVTDKISHGRTCAIGADVAHGALVSVAAWKVVGRVSAASVDGAAIGRAAIFIVAI